MLDNLLIVKLHDIPAEDREITFQQLDIMAKKMNGPRIALVPIYLAESTERRDA